MKVRAWVRSRFVTVDAVYGLILYAALVAGVSDSHTDSFEVLWFSLSSLVVFWGAHVFAGTVVRHGETDGVTTRLRSAIWLSIGASSGMLYAAILPSVPLVLGAFHLLSTDDAVNYSLFASMLTLGVMGYQSFARRGKSLIIRILGALGTASFGFLVILINYLAH